MIGFMGNNVLPAHLGELIRVFVLGRQFSLSKSAVLSSVVLERILDATVILLLLAASLLLLEELPVWVMVASTSLTVFTFFAILFLAVYVLWTQWFIRAAQRALAFLRPQLLRKATEMMESGKLGFLSLRSPRLCFWIILTSIVHWILMGAMIYVSLWSFSLYLTPLASFLVLGVSALGVSVPSSPGFFGVIQLCFWVSLRLFGVDKADAFASSVYYHLSQYVPVTVLGLYYLGRYGLKLREIEKKLTG